jgi:hypothetical protein
MGDNIPHFFGPHFPKQKRTRWNYYSAGAWVRQRLPVRKRGGKVGGCGGKLVWGRGGLVGGVGRDGDGVETCSFFGMYFSVKIKQKFQISGFLFTTFKDACRNFFLKKNSIRHAAAGGIKGIGG